MARKVAASVRTPGSAPRGAHRASARRDVLSQHRVQCLRRPRIDREGFLFQPETTARKLPHQSWGLAEIQVLGPDARLPLRLEELSPERRHKPTQVGPEPAQMLKDADAIRIEITEMDHGDAGQALQKASDCCRVPARYMNYQPPVESVQIAERAEVLDEQRCADGPFEGQTSAQGALRDRHFAEDTRDGGKVEIPKWRDSNESLRWPDAHRTVVSGFRFTEGRDPPISERCLGVRRNECRRGTPVDLIWKLRQSLRTPCIFELGPAIRRRRKPQRCQRSETPRPRRHWRGSFETRRDARTDAADRTHAGDTHGAKPSAMNDQPAGMR